MELKDIQNLIKFVAKSGTSEVKLEMEDIKITIKTGGEAKIETSLAHQASILATQQPKSEVVVSEQVIINSQNNTPEEISSNLIEIKSPMIGTFYRRPSPDKQNFVEVGDTVSLESIVCIVEAMKLFNEIESEVAGKIVKVFVEEGSPVEFGQPLFLVEPV
jgi:acetyl-CoA carboxylase biotin carboxyl carrier protein